MRINQNVMANNASRILYGTSTEMGKSVEKLSSGFRINRAADDASGLVISQGLRAQRSSLSMAVRNAQDGISVLQTAEGALTEVHTMLQRMRDLAVQSANTGVADSTSVGAAQAEITALNSEITRIASTTKFGTKNLLDGTYGRTAGVISAFDTNNTITVAAGNTITVNVTGGSGVTTVALSAGTYNMSAFATHLTGAVKSVLGASANANDRLAADGFSASATTVGAGAVITVSNLHNATVAIADGTGTPLATGGISALIGTVAAATGTAASFQVGAGNGETVSFSITNQNAATLGTSAIDVTTAAGAAAALTTLDAAITSVSTTRGGLGALSNRFESIINNLEVTQENLTASESRIRDTDMADEMVSFTKFQVLQQAGTAMLSQANQVPQSILSLLR